MPNLLALGLAMLMGGCAAGSDAKSAAAPVAPTDPIVTAEVESTIPPVASTTPTSPATLPPVPTSDTTSDCGAAASVLQTAFENDEDLESSRFDDVMATWAECNDMSLEEAYGYWVGSAGEPSDNPPASPEDALSQALSTIADVTDCYPTTAPGASTPAPLSSFQCQSDIAPLSDTYFLVFDSPEVTAQWVYNSATENDCVTDDDGTFTFVVCPVGDIDNFYNLYFALDGCNVATFLSVVDDPGHDVNAALERLAVGYLTYSS